MFATCSYADYTDRAGYLPVRASVGAPRGGIRFAPYTTRLLPVLAAAVPESTWVAQARTGTLTQAGYTALYVPMIRQRQAQLQVQARQIRRTAKVPESTRLVLLCFCRLDRPGEWCHRTMFAAAWTAMTGEEVPELGRVRVPEIAADEPPKLF